MELQSLSASVLSAIDQAPRKSAAGSAELPVSTFADAIAASSEAGKYPNAISGTANSLVSSATASPLLQWGQQDSLEAGTTGRAFDAGGSAVTNPFTLMNASDRRLIEAATGWTIGADGKFQDGGGNPIHYDFLANHSIDTMIMTIAGARAAEAQGVHVPGISDVITPAEFSALSQRWQANSASMGETFDPSLVQKGLAYLNTVFGGGAA